MADRRAKGPSLRVRLMLWMLLSAVLSLSVFAVTTYVVVSLEEREDLSPQAGPETPSEITTETAEEVAVALAIAGPVALLLSVVGAAWISRRTLAPLHAVVRAAEDMGASDLHRRLRVPAGDPELAELVTALNELFERLESGFGALQRYAADASHELRTPLAVMASEIEVASRQPRSPDEWRRTAEVVLSEVRRLTGLVEALLDLARLDALPGAGDATFDLADVVEQALAPVRPHAGSSGVTLAAEAYADGPVRVHGNADALAGALTNLLSNAVRYTPEGGAVRLSVEDRGDRVALHVDDSGPGVAATERDAIFGRFARGEAGRASDDRGGPGGVGLGLATARQVATLHGGTLSVTDSPLGGARFTLTLPRAAR